MLNISLVDDILCKNIVQAHLNNVIEGLYIPTKVENVILSINKQSIRSFSIYFMVSPLGWRVIFILDTHIVKMNDCLS